MAEWVKTAKVGDQIVCIKRGGWNAINGDPSGAPKPCYGQICTIALIRVPDHSDDAFFGLEGFFPFDTFWSGHFKPLETREPDLSVFTDMLKTTSKPVEEMV